MKVMLEVAGVSKRFGGLRALDGVSFSIAEGRISSLIGPNGAGKTTAMNVIAGDIRPDSGRVLFDGEDITGLRPYQACWRGIARTYQLKNIFPALTVYDNVLAGMLKERGTVRSKESEVLRILDFVGLRHRAQVLARNLPPLEAKLVELGRALATRPKLLLLDELIGGLMPSETEQICTTVMTLRDEGYTILQVSHEMGPIMQTSDWVVVLNKGQKLAEGTPNEIRCDPDVQAVYLESGGEMDE
ncbi:ABC transporter ATP-binding protein [Candidatus Bipolaricaulota bacterium]|nr:ABC transporter ATP-binding protein [Candidatus Bipolaricaulota bacterium]